MERISIYNTLSRSKEPFVPVKEGEVSMYVCGPTVYNKIHIGNARPLIVFDTISRYLQYVGYNVKFISNVTDIDDKIIKKANELGKTMEEVSSEFAGYFMEDRANLGVLEPDESPYATKYIGQMIALIKKLVDTGYAYAVDGNVFFEAGKFEDYGKLSRKNFEDFEIGDRVGQDVQDQKRDPVRDFSLWKAAKPGEPKWQSPWGEGRPGWHTECVVMSSNLLGDEFDIHGGGIDLEFPHHENEIAQARCGNNAPFAKYWMHNEFLNIKNEKMAKSLGNAVLASEVIEKYRVEAIRLFFHQTHYRKSISFDYSLLEAAESAIDKLERFLTKAYGILNDSKVDLQKVDLDERSAKMLEPVLEAMNDDFNTAKAVGAMFTIVSDLTEKVQKGSWADDEIRKLAAGVAALKKVDQFFGILPEVIVVSDEEKAKIEQLIADRKRFRAEKNWQEADHVRAELTSMNISIEDTPDGTRWSKLS